MAHNLAPYALERLGLAETLGEMIERVQRSSGITFTHELESMDGSLSRDLEVCLYRVAQEAINNIAKHSGASAASMSLNRSATGVRLVIADNGRGFDVARPSQGMGLAAMAERIRLFKGEYRVRSAEGKGTTIEINVGNGKYDA